MLGRPAQRDAVSDGQDVSRRIVWPLHGDRLSRGADLVGGIGTEKNEIRYLAIENAQVSLACQGGLQSWLCSTFRLAIWLYNHSAFGGVALTAAVLNLLRPSLVLITVALASAGFGLVLHNADLSGLAVALLILSLARPAPAAA